jgi:hypothetical protein
MTLINLYEKMMIEHNHNQGFTDKGLPYHTYIYVYDKELAPYKKNINMLEIGVDHGGSLALWKKYFENYKLVGFDLHPNPIEGMPYTEDLLADENITLKFGRSSTDRGAAAEFEDKTFDVIIDDGSHDPNIQIETFKVWISKLKDKGVFFIEDILGYAYGSVRKEVEAYLKEKNIEYVLEDYLGDVTRLVRDDDKILIVRLK